MIHPSYSELMQVVNSDTELDDEPLVNSRYSIVLATSKRARQLIGGDETMLDKYVGGRKPLSVAVEELYTGKVKILPEGETAESEGAEGISVDPEKDMSAESFEDQNAEAEEPIWQEMAEAGEEPAVSDEETEADTDEI
ncbi:MAG TPA: DNA-directed RNA polymerase subunit omega [Lachnospiraceae bacterium]|nr:DNA-directed RNA polymerase subunit omega [Lachnospiraceae bacterium]